jgi:hypothetical protein
VQRKISPAAPKLCDTLKAMLLGIAAVAAAADRDRVCYCLGLVCCNGLLCTSMLVVVLCWWHHVTCMADDERCCRYVGS